MKCVDPADFLRTFLFEEGCLLLLLFLLLLLARLEEEDLDEVEDLRLRLLLLLLTSSLTKGVSASRMFCLFVRMGLDALR